MINVRVEILIVTFFLVLILCSSGLAVVVVEPGYGVETFASYSEPGLGEVQAMSFDNSGNLYLTQPGNNSIWRISSGGIASKFVSGLSARGIVWGGGTSYGNYLYVVANNKIVRVGLDGTKFNFANRYCASPLALDRLGIYSGYLYTATSCQDRTYRINTGGGVNLFADFPGWKDGGGPWDIAFDTEGDYYNLMYMAVSFNNSHGNEKYSGLFSLSSSGSASRFTNDLLHVYRIAFDIVGNLGGDMFVISESVYGAGGLTAIHRILPDGTATLFATSTNFDDLIFGPDGLLYVAEYDAGSETITISRIGEPRVLEALEIVGPNEVAENSNASYKAIAHYDIGNPKDVTALADWSVEPNDNCSIAAGLLTTEMVDLPQDLTIYAEYSEDGNTVEAEKEVSIFAICPSGSALEFDGVNDYVEVGNKISLEPISLTISAWVRPKEVSSLQQIAGKYGHEPVDNCGYGYRLEVRNDKASLLVDPWGCGNWDPLESTTSLQLGQWYFVTGTYDGSTAKIYLNGEPENSGARTLNAYYTNFYIGACYSDYHNAFYDHFDGQIDEVAIYDRALSAEEIQGLMHTRPAGDEPNLVAYWDFDEGEGQAAEDSSGNDNDGTLGSTEEVDDSDPCWVGSVPPVGICNLEGLVGRNISNVLDIKADILELLDIALGKEEALLDYMDDAFHNDQFDNLNKNDVVLAKQKLHSAIQHEEQAETTIGQSLEKLNDALDALGIDPTSWHQSEIEEEIIRADINADGVVDFRDFTILTEHWLKSSRK